MYSRVLAFSILGEVIDDSHHETRASRRQGAAAILSAIAEKQP